MITYSRKDIQSFPCLVVFKRRKRERRLQENEMKSCFFHAGGHSINVGPKFPSSPRWKRVSKCSVAVKVNGAWSVCRIWGYTFIRCQVPATSRFTTSLSGITHSEIPVQTPHYFWCTSCLKIWPVIVIREVVLGVPVDMHSCGPIQ